jgi:hypothetical protein
MESLHGFADLVKLGCLHYGAKNRRDGDLNNLPGELEIVAGGQDNN